MKFNPEELANYAMEHSRKEALQHFGCSVSTLNNACVAFNVPSDTVRKYKRISEWVEGNIASIEDAASHFTESPATVRIACIRNGVTPAQHSKVAAVSTLEVVALLIQGHRQADIAREMHVARQRVNSIATAARKAGLIGEDAICVAKGSHATS